MKHEKKLVAIIGPTAVGKSTLGVELALRFSGEVVSADSRQVYKGLDIGSGKITPQEMRGVPHHLLDIVSPTTQLTVSEYKEAADEIVEDIIARGNAPFLVGGSGLYVQAVVYNKIYPDVPPNKNLRDALAQKDTHALFTLLEQKDPRRATTIDRNNKRRIIRSLEIIDVLGAVPPPKQGKSHYKTLQIGLDLPDAKLRERIKVRLHRRLESGMIEEVEKLLKSGVTHERLEKLGLEYRYVSRFLQHEIDRGELEEVLYHKVWQFAKRQRTWFKRDSNIQWFTSNERTKMSGVVETFLESEEIDENSL